MTLVLTDDDRRQAAILLEAAEQQRSPIEPLTTRWPDLSVTDAYEIQQINIRSREARGAIRKGHKVGLTAKAMQEMLGVGEPDFGHLMDDMFVLEGGQVAAESLCFPRVEIEVAFVLGSELRGPGVVIGDVLRATEFVVPAIEIIDSRIRDWQITLADTIADNASSAGVVLGGNPTPLSGVDLRTIQASLMINGSLAGTGSSADVLGNPAAAVAWLANKLSEFGHGLEAGEVVLPGSCTRAFDVERGDEVTGQFDTLGPVAVSFA